jgi:hypothetical protein
MYGLRMGTDYRFFDTAERMYGLRMGTDYGFFDTAERMYGLRMGTDYRFFISEERLPVGRQGCTDYRFVLLANLSQVFLTEIRSSVAETY